MKKIKVYLQYPWNFPDSPYYKYLIDYPPENVEYLNIEKQKGVIINKKKVFLLNSLKDFTRNMLGFLKLPLPNVHLTKTTKYFELIHCAHCLSLNRRHWVADFESAWQMFISGETTFLSKKIIQRIVDGIYCKKIISWTEATKKDLIRIFPNLKNKIEIVYPAVPIQKRKKKNEKEIVILFVGRYFYAKGGFHSLQIINRLTRKNRKVRGVIVSDVPDEIKKKYSNNRKIDFFNLMPQKELFDKAYSMADIFLYPGYSDTFGFAILEAMSFGLPVVTADGFARKELVEHGKTGFVVKASKKRGWKENYLRIENENETIRSLTRCTEILIKDKMLRRELSKNCMETIKNGKFSIKERNKKLRRIYKEVLTN